MVATKMVVRKRAVRLIKTVWFLTITFSVGYFLAPPEAYLNHEMISKICNVIYGDVNAETMYETHTNIDMLMVFSFSVFIYFVTVKTFSKIRR